MTDKESIISKIRKLLAFDGDTATQAEVEAAMGRAQVLMERHAIEMADLEEDQGAEADPIQRDRIAVELNGRTANWEVTLANAVEMAVPGVNHYRAREYRKPKFGGIGDRSRKVMTCVFYGPADAVEVASRLFAETREIIATMATGVYSSPYSGEGRSYAEGFAKALFDKARASRSASDNAERLGEIVLVREEQNKNWLSEAHGVNLVSASMSTSGRHHSSAYGAGTKDGQNHEFKPGQATSKLAGGMRALPL